MIKKYKPISWKLPKFYHGADYNPEQWLKHPEILEEDIRLMKLAHCNVMSLGIFSWVTLEPEEGVFNFEWLDDVINKLYGAGIYTILATPTGARPAWMSAEDEEVLRVSSDRTRNLHGERHNHCFTSPVYRKRTALINQKLAERYGKHPAIIAWHISNEYGGECHCELCQEAFRGWLKNKYKTLEVLNHAWWTAFWSHTYTSWNQIVSPSLKGEMSIHGLNLDWKRFVTDQTVSFMKAEILPLKKVNKDIPVVVNMMGTYEGLNYWKFAKEVDVISWDNYPRWHYDIKDDVEEGVKTSMVHDLNRSLRGGQPFMLMESTPSQTNWHAVCKPKKPGMHVLSSLQAVAHGSDTVQYFQWRKSRGSVEKFHGAVVDHCGHEHTRVFKEVQQVGGILDKLDEILGTSVQAEVAIILDWENRWALQDAKGPRNGHMNYEESIVRHYKAFWKQGIPVDIINEECDFKKYKILVAPMLYMLRPGVADRIQAFVEAGGVFVATYWTGIVDETDLCFMGGFPGPLKKTLGIWSEEIDPLYDDEKNRIVYKLNDGGVAEYEAVELCEVIHVEGAKVLAVYGEDYYANRPAVTVNKLGEGKAYYIATKSTESFYDDFYKEIIEESKVKRALVTELPYGVTAQLRESEDTDYIFIMNFTRESKIIKLHTRGYLDLLENKEIEENIILKGYGLSILKYNK